MRGHGDVLMGKNTMMKKTIKDCLDTHPQLEKLLPLIKKNVGFVMTNGELNSLQALRAQVPWVQVLPSTFMTSIASQIVKMSLKIGTLLLLFLQWL